MRVLSKGERRELERRLCPIDHKYFTPRFRGQKTCGGACARRLVGRKLKARGTPPALARRQEHNRLRLRIRVAQETSARFGALSERERQLFLLAERVGYDKGYCKGYHHRRRGKRPDWSAAS